MVAAALLLALALFSLTGGAAFANTLDEARAACNDKHWVAQGDTSLANSKKQEVEEKKALVDLQFAWWRYEHEGETIYYAVLSAIYYSNQQFEQGTTAYNEAMEKLNSGNTTRESAMGYDRTYPIDPPADDDYVAHTKYNSAGCDFNDAHDKCVDDAIPHFNNALVQYDAAYCWMNPPPGE